MSTDNRAVIALVLVAAAVLVSGNEAENKQLDTTQRQEYRLKAFKQRVTHRLPHDYMKTDVYIIRWLRGNVTEAAAYKKLTKSEGGAKGNIFEINLQLHKVQEYNTKNIMFAEYVPQVFMKFINKVLGQGPMPQHVEIIMDGNRRYARKNKLEDLIQGHMQGEQTLKETLKVLEYLEIPELTIYVFSNENFKRPKSEIEQLMEVLQKGIAEIMPSWFENDVQVEIFGDYTKAPLPSVVTCFAEAMLISKKNSKFRLNIAFAYGGQVEIANCLSTMLNGLKENFINIADLSESLVEQTFTLSNSRPVDLLIRTGGDTRLSDFMLWQSGSAYLEFVDGVTWPEFKNWHLARAIFHYQVSVLFCGLPRSRNGNAEVTSESSDRVRIFLDTIRNAKWESIKQSLKIADGK